MTCPECCSVIPSDSWECSECGYQFQKMKEPYICPKCHQKIPFKRVPKYLYVVCPNDECDYIEFLQTFPEPFQAEEAAKPHCPTCGSTNIKKLSTTKRITHGAMFGLFSKTARSQWECKNCGNKW